MDGGVVTTVRNAGGRVILRTWSLCRPQGLLSYMGLLALLFKVLASSLADKCQLSLLASVSVPVSSHFPPLLSNLLLLEHPGGKVARTICKTGVYRGAVVVQGPSCRIK